MILFIVSVQVQKQEYTFFVRFFLFFSFLYQVVHILLAEMTPLPPFFSHMKQTHFKDFYKFVLLINEKAPINLLLQSSIKPLEICDVVHVSLCDCQTHPHTHKQDCTAVHLKGARDRLRPGSWA